MLCFGLSICFIQIFGLQGFIKDGYFNFKSSAQFKISGYPLLMISNYNNKFIRHETNIWNRNIIWHNNILIVISYRHWIVEFSDVIKRKCVREWSNNIYAYNHQLRYNARHTKMRSNELAEQMGITTANLSILKTAKAKPYTILYIEAICEILECQPEIFYSM
jgi:putative transcriptional regulator